MMTTFQGFKLNLQYVTSIGQNVRYHLKISCFSEDVYKNKNCSFLISLKKAVYRYLPTARTFLQNLHILKEVCLLFCVCSEGTAADYSSSDTLCRVFFCSFLEVVLSQHEGNLLPYNCIFMRLHNESVQ